MSLFVTLAVADGRAWAGGWQEAHQTADDVRIVVGPDGIGTIEHHLRFRVVAGRFKTFDLPGFDPHVEPVGPVAVTSEKGGEFPAHLEAHPKQPELLRIVLDDEPKGLTRGVYVVDFKVRVDLAAAKMVTRDGAMWKLAWTAPAAPEGHDGARVTFALPSAPTEPRLASTSPGAPSDGITTTLTTLHRMPDHDELELVRAHVPRGEAVTWAARVDPKAFPDLKSAELRPPGPPVAPPPEHENARTALVSLGLAAAAGILAAIARKKARMVEATMPRGHRPRPLVPVSGALSPFLFGLATLGGLASFFWASSVLGAVAIVVAMALVTNRSPVAPTTPRGPGRWRPISDERALVVPPAAPGPGDWLDVTTTRGRVVAFLTACIVAGLAFALRARLAGAVFAVPLSACALVPLFVTGSRAQLPPSPVMRAARFLRPARDAFARMVDLAHVRMQCLARFREGSTGEFDEVRLACAPLEPIPGLVGIELALAAGAADVAAVAEVLVRVREGSEAAARVARVAPKFPIVVGRSAEERVLCLVPDEPGPRGAAALLARLVRELEGRRATDRAELTALAARPRYTGPERRTAPKNAPNLPLEGRGLRPSNATYASA